MIAGILLPNNSTRILCVLFTVVPFLLSFICFLSYYPGWMSPDSIAQYSEAKSGLYNDWHPPLMAWWWGMLLNLWDGPQPILIQNLLFYWGGWGLLAWWAKKRIGVLAIAIPLVGLWPGVSFPLGQIWKDIWFAVPLLYLWMMLLNIEEEDRKLSTTERFIGLFCIMLSISAKTNGIVSLPFLAFYWSTLEIKVGKNITGRRITFTGALLLIGIGVPLAISTQLPIRNTNSFQYTQVYDLLAISVAENENFLPKYVKEKINSIDLADLYVIGNNNKLFYDSFGNLTTTNPQDLSELNSLWISTILSHPTPYVRHRWANFLSLLRFGEPHPATVAAPVIVDNKFGLVARANIFSSYLGETVNTHPWIYFPWIYMVLFLNFAFFALLLKKNVRFVALLSISTIAFVAPHLAITPGADYRYLYYAYICTIVLIVFCLVQLAAKIKEKCTGRHNLLSQSIERPALDISDRGET